MRETTPRRLYFPNIDLTWSISHLVIGQHWTQAHVVESSVGMTTRYHRMKTQKGQCGQKSVTAAYCGSTTYARHWLWRQYFDDELRLRQNHRKNQEVNLLFVSIKKGMNKCHSFVNILSSTWTFYELQEFVNISWTFQNNIWTISWILIITLPQDKCCNINYHSFAVND